MKADTEQASGYSRGGTRAKRVGEGAGTVDAGRRQGPQVTGIVGQSELGYTDRQLALVEGLPSPDAARMALRRAMIRLSGAVRDS